GAPANDSLPVIDLKADQIAAKSTDLVALQSPVRNQSHRGVCTIFSTTALMEHLYIKAGMANPDFSEQYLQWSVKKQLGAFDDSGGRGKQENGGAAGEVGGGGEAVGPVNPNEGGPAGGPGWKADGPGAESLPAKGWTQGEPPAAASTATKYKLPSGSWLSTK